MESTGQEELLEAGEEITDENKARRDKADCSHRVIEKRRRDRINNSLMQLSKLVPVEKFNKKNSGKLEKAEILEVTVQYLTEQQQKLLREQDEQKANSSNQSSDELNQGKVAEDQCNRSAEVQAFLRGFKECISVATKFFQEVEELDVSEGRCHRLIQHLKKQVLKHENKDGVAVKATGDDRVWEGGDSVKEHGSRRSSVQEMPILVPNSVVKIEVPKRKNEKENGTSKKRRVSTSETNGNEAQSSNEQGTTSPANSANDMASVNGDSSNAMRNFMPFLFPNFPFIPTFPFTGANSVARYPTSQTQFSGYSFPQSATPYIPVALPQFPYMGMNFMSGFGVMNNEQQQNNGMANAIPNGMPSNMVNTMQNGIPSGIPNAMPNAMPNGMAAGFLPSMYSNGIHANLLAMRPRDSGYESSDRSSSSKGSRSETSPQSFSDDSCQSFN